MQSLICSTCNGTVESVIAGAVAAIPGTLASEVKDLQSTYNAEQAVLAQGNSETIVNSGNFCDDVGNVVNDLSNVINDASNLSDDAGNVQSDISQEQSALSTLKADFTAYQKAQAQLPSFVPENAPTEQEVSAAVDRVTSAVTSAVTTTNQYIDQANADVSTAYGYALAATKVGNCGGAPSPPQPVQHI